MGDDDPARNAVCSGQRAVCRGERVAGMTFFFSVLFIALSKLVAKKPFQEPPRIDGQAEERRDQD